MPRVVKVAKESEIEPGTAKCVEAGGRKIAIFNLDGEFFAIEDTCTHDDGSLSEGTIQDDEIECPLHGACFNIRTGEVTCPPAVSDVETFTVQVSGEDIEVLLDN
jgi:3-phenylpropionate/trans-cinnamate dioxygenase ferredoxin subunit